MTESVDMSERIASVSDLLREKTGASGKTFADQAQKARRRLPRHAARQAALISEAETLLDNPRLRPIVTDPRYDAAIDGLTTHLQSIDLTEKRKRWWLGMFGGMAFNLLAATVIFLAALRIAGFI